MTILGAIIAGGAARRFGADKGAVLLHGTALIDHVVQSLRSQTDALIVVGRDWQGLKSIADRPRGDEGPLGGLCAALHYASEQGHDAVLCAGCDTLPVPAELRSILSPGPAVVDGHWLMSLWPSALAEDLDRWLAGQPDRSIRGWMRHVGAKAVSVETRFYNINMPKDLAEAEREMRAGQS